MCNVTEGVSQPPDHVGGCSNLKKFTYDDSLTISGFILRSYIVGADMWLGYAWQPIWIVLCKWKTRLASRLTKVSSQTSFQYERGLSKVFTFNRFFIVTRANAPLRLSLGISFLIANVASLLYVSKSLFQSWIKLNTHHIAFPSLRS